LKATNMGLLNLPSMSGSQDLDVETGHHHSRRDQSDER
jgi:hypothetical protein